MGSNDAAKVVMPGTDIAEDSETTVEIKIRTLDSQTYTLRVNKRVRGYFLLPWYNACPNNKALSSIFSWTLYN